MYGERPAWYHRVYKIAVDRGRVNLDRYLTRPDDYDEDISDLESEVSCSSQNGCEYDSDDMCLKHGDSDSEDDDTSDDGGGSDIDGYYQFKGERKERKRDLRDQGNHHQDKLGEDLELEIRFENEVKEVLAKLQASTKKKPSPLKRIGGRVRSYKVHQFFSDDEFDWDKDGKPELKQNEFEGHIYMMSEDIAQVQRFTPPKLPSTKTYKLEVGVGDSTVGVQFIDDNYLVLKIPQELVFTNVHTKIPSEAPRVFTYYGVCQRHMVEQDKREQKKERRRSASPE
ncbi:hypothetical protein NW762_013837 [Fusarium torreyae]|uniref:Uncharacterized protein n=1 Tax=Fusarium torreyae TaxID=1237075 RepID=A0A9W8RMG7_9HYPO|nr:hypothetical protein NW762_013837 [Fusarium torreyae]